jgi:hypothetical protein
MPRHPVRDFKWNVFINCPFDREYESLLRPLLFTILAVGYTPKIALERSDSGEQRITKICQLIKSSKYSIHDLSRLRASRRREFYRLNMPFELGIEYGCREFSTNHLSTKRCLILEQKRYNYSKALSDLSGVDIKNHGNNPQSLIRAVRNWFIETVRLRNLKSSTVIWYDFNAFMADFYLQRKAEGYRRADLSMMPVGEFVSFIQNWLKRRP